MGLKSLFHNHLWAAAQQDFESPAWQKKHDFSENISAVTSSKSGIFPFFRNIRQVSGASLHYIRKEGLRMHDMCFDS